MKKIDELLSEVNLKEEDYELFEEETILEEEMADIREKVFAALEKSKATEIQETAGVSKKDNNKKENEEKEVMDGADKKVMVLKDKKRRKTKKWILPLVATLALGSSLIAGVSGGDLSGLFEGIFGEHTSNIGESGLILGISDKQQGISLNVEGMVGDKQNAIILFNLEKEGDKVFQGNSIKFGELKFEVEENKFKGWNPFKSYGTSSSSYSYGWQVIDKDNEEKDKRVIKLDASLDQELIGKKATLTIKDIIEVEEDYWDSEVNLAEFLRQHLEQMDIKTITMPEELLTHVSAEELRHEGHNEQEIKEIMNNIPKRALPEGNLDLDLYPSFEGNWKVDNIGFIENQLHIRMSGTGNNHYRPDFKDALGNEAEMTYNITTYSTSEKGEGISQGYYVYDIKDLETLSQMKVSSWFQKEISKTEGTWQVEFTIDIKNQEKHITTDKTIPWGDGTQLIIKEIVLSNLSLQVTYSGQQERSFPKAIVKFKDGTESQAYRQAASYGENQSECIYAFQYPIDIEEVDSIMINEVEIKPE